GPGGRPVPGPTTACPRRRCPPETRSTCWYRRRSSVRFQLRQRAAKADLSSHLAQPGICLGCRQQLQSGTNGLCDAGSAGLLCFLQKFSRYLDRDFSRGWHSGSQHTILNTSIQYGKASHSPPRPIKGRQKPHPTKGRLDGAPYCSFTHQGACLGHPPVEDPTHSKTANEWGTRLRRSQKRTFPHSEAWFARTNEPKCAAKSR